MENKQLILDSLADALRQTRKYDKLANLELNPETEIVTAHFMDGMKVIDVACDSGIAMIKDVIRGLE